MKFRNSIFLICTVILCAIITTGCDGVKNEKEVKVENDYVLEFKNGERFFKSEITPKSDSENAILDYFKIEISDEYDEFKNAFVDSEKYTFYPETYKKKLSEGLFTEELTVHSLITLKEDEYINDISGPKYYPYMESLKEFNPKAFEIIEVNYTKKLTDEYNKIAQFGSGNWTRYYVVVKENKDSNWKIFDVYGHM